MNQENKIKLGWLIPFAILYLSAVFIDGYWMFKDMPIPNDIIVLKDVLYTITLFVSMMMISTFRENNWIIGWKELKPTGKVVER